MPAKLTYTQYHKRKISISKKDFLADKEIDVYVGLILDIANAYHCIEGGMANLKYNSFQQPIEAYNKGFKALYKDKNLFAAMAMNRILLDHLIYLYADYLYPDYDIIEKVYNKGKDLNQIKINGEQIKPLYIRNLIEERYEWMGELWDRYNNYIHPSTHTGSYSMVIKPLKKRYKSEPDGCKTVTVKPANQFNLDTALSDIVKINNALLCTLKDIRDEKLKEIKELGLSKKHIEAYYDARGGKKKSVKQSPLVAKINKSMRLIAKK